MRYVLLFVIIFFIVCKCMSQHPATWFSSCEKVHKDSIEATLHLELRDNYWIYFLNKAFTISKKPKGKNIARYGHGTIDATKKSSVRGFTKVQGGFIQIKGRYGIPKGLKEWIYLSYPYTIVDSTGHYINYIIHSEMNMKRRVHKLNTVVDTFISLPSCRCGSEFDF